MPEVGRVIAFPSRQVEVGLTRDEARALADIFVATPAGSRSHEDYEQLRNPDALFAVVAKLREEMNSAPMTVSEDAAGIHLWLSSGKRVGVFDETDFFLGELALIATTAYRHLGQFDVAERWLETAEISLSHTVDSAAAAARTAYARLTIRFDQREWQAVLDSLPQVVRNFDRLNMGVEAHKARFLEAMTLKAAGSSTRSLECFESLRGSLSPAESPLLARVLIEIGADRASRENYSEAVAIYEEAAELLAGAGDPMPAAHLKGSIGEAYRSQGEYNIAVDSYRVAMKEFAALGMQTTVAYYRVIVAETLLLARRDREAEWEIRAALPVIEEQKMLPDAAAAILLLRESIQRRSVDKSALGQVRQELAKLA